MASGSVVLTAVLMMILHGWAAGAVQGRGWHVELSDGTTGYVILVNDSEKTIESLHAIGRCGGVPSEARHDALAIDGNLLTVPHLADRNRTTEDVVAEPGARFFVPNIGLYPQRSGCQWEADVDAVLFSDGSYGGDWHVAQQLEAKRDGTIAAVGYWTERFHASPGNGLTTLADAKRLVEWDSARALSPVCNGKSIACEYWSAVLHVDGSVAMQGHPSSRTPEQIYAAMVSEIERWQKKIDANSAWRKLDTTFPLPEELAGPTILQARDLAAPARSPQ